MVLTFELGLGATVYHIWNLRNPVLHKGCVNYEEQVISAIWKLVKARIEFKNSFHPTDQIRETCCRWGFTVSLLLWFVWIEREGERVKQSRVDLVQN